MRDRAEKTQSSEDPLASFTFILEALGQEVYTVCLLHAAPVSYILNSRPGSPLMCQLLDSKIIQFLLDYVSSGNPSQVGCFGDFPAF